MSRFTKYRSGLRILYAALLSSDLTPTDLESLAEELRSGELPHELAYMINQTSRHLKDDRSRTVASESAYEIEQLLKNQGLSKSELISLLTSIGSNSKVSRSTTIAKLIGDFVSDASSQQIVKLKDLLQSGSAADSFLKGIAETRK